MERKIAFLEAPVSCGSPTRGAERACAALIGGLEAMFPQCAYYPMEAPAPCENYPENLLHLGTVMAVSRRLRENMLTAFGKGEFPVVIGGDHSVAMGSLAAVGETYGAESTALVYIDAHTDINTEETSVSHCIHGMDLAAACGLCCDELTAGKQKVNLLGENIHFIGARSIDPPESDIMTELGTHCTTAEELNRRGAEEVLRELLPRLAGKRVHISFDVDFLDPMVFRATGYNIPDGGTWEQAVSLVRGLIKSGFVCSLECVEYNPLLDGDGRDRAALGDFFRETEKALEER